MRLWKSFRKSKFYKDFVGPWFNDFDLGPSLHRKKPVETKPLDDAALASVLSPLTPTGLQIGQWLDAFDDDILPYMTRRGLTRPEALSIYLSIEIRSLLIDGFGIPGFTRFDGTESGEDGDDDDDLGPDGQDPLPVGEE